MEEEDSNSVQDSSYINDIRHPSDFKGITFSKYKKTEVRDSCLENMSKGKVEPSCYWCAELICAGHFTDIWDIFLFFLGKYIHLGNPKLTIYLDQRYQMFRTIMENALYTQELQLRNNIQIRRLFAEVMSVIIKSPHKHHLTPLKKISDDDFDMNTMSEKLKAPTTKLVDEIFLEEDPKELYIALNEFAYQLTQTQGTMMATYWLEWILEFDAFCKKRDVPCHCQRRSQVPVAATLQSDVVWMIWDALQLVCKQENKGMFVKRVLDALLRLFCIKYTPATGRKRKSLLYFAIELITEGVDTPVELILDKHVVEAVVRQINNIYREIKKNEESPQTDYLFQNMERDDSNIEKSMRKLEILVKGTYGSL